MMQSQPPPPAQPGMADAVRSGNPMSIAAQPIGTAGPTPEDTSDGIVQQLHGLVSGAQQGSQVAQAIAASNPQVASEMNAILQMSEAIQKLCVQAALKTQQQGGNQQPQAPGGY